MTAFNKDDWPEMIVFAERSGPSGNVFSIIGEAERCMKVAGVPREVISEYRKVAMSDDYENALRVTGEYVTLEFL